MKTWRLLIIFIALFLGLYFFPAGILEENTPLGEALLMSRDYARHHVLLCLIPAFFIAGAISVLLRKDFILKYLGRKSNKILSYLIASVSGAVLSVCSCTVLPIFAGISKKGAGPGPAFAFLYSGPAINIMAVILTARVLGFKLGIWRIILSVLFALVIGIIMGIIFSREEPAQGELADENVESRPLHHDILFLSAMTGFLIFANFPRPENSGIFELLFNMKWVLSGLFLILSFIFLFTFYDKDSRNMWLGETMNFVKKIYPLLLLGVFASGFLLGRPGKEGLIPSDIIVSLVGGEGFFANILASVLAALMYFATLTEIPILQSLIGSGMGQGPSMALLLAGPALSLPSMLVLIGVIGKKKAFTYIALVIIIASLSGLIFGAL